MSKPIFRLTAGTDLNVPAGTTLVVDEKTGTVVPEEGYHDGVVYGIRHPGPTQLGCPYCIDTLQLPIRAGAKS